MINNFHTINKSIRLIRYQITEAEGLTNEAKRWDSSPFRLRMTIIWNSTAIIKGSVTIIKNIIAIIKNSVTINIGQYGNNKGSYGNNKGPYGNNKGPYGNNIGEGSKIWNSSPIFQSIYCFN